MTEHPTPDAGPAGIGEPNTKAFNADVPHATAERPLSAAARRALMEAADRRAARQALDLAPEHGGPTGPEPTRYSDWEKKGIAVDF